MSEIRIRGIDPDTHQGLKIAAIESRTTLEELIKTILREWLERRSYKTR